MDGAGRNKMATYRHRVGRIANKDQWTVVVHPVLQIRLIVDRYPRDVGRQACKLLKPRWGVSLEKFDEDRS